MAGKIPREFIDDLLVRVDIVDLIDSLVPLKKTGNHYKALCPFHAEKSPSFSVNRKQQFYHCFGCGVGGNAISFLMAFSHLGFVEAIEDLADFAGVEVPREAGNITSPDLSQFYAILEQVAVFYLTQLRQPQNKGVIDYLKNRALGGEIAHEFSLGYAPNSWDALAAQFDHKRLIEVGMLTEREGTGVYDRFRGRLVFPIKNRRGRIVGFGGRVLDDSQPKYLNSPETPVFSKSKELYGLYELLEKNAKPDYILVVEGYLDVLTLVQAGIHSVVAVLGTAVSRPHLEVLFRFTSVVIFCFDGDSAGQQATWRAVEASFSLLRDGRQIKILSLSAGQDPDTCINDEGVNRFLQRIESAQVLSDYFFNYLAKKADLSTVEGRSLLATKAKPYIEKIPQGIYRDLLTKALAEKTSVLATEILIPPTESIIEDRAVTSNTAITPERAVLALLIQTPELIEVIDEMVLDWNQLIFPSKDWLLDLISVIHQYKPDNTGRLLELYRDNKEKEAILFKLANLEVLPLTEGEFNIKAEFKGALSRVLEQGRKTYLDARMEKKIKRNLT